MDDCRAREIKAKRKARRERRNDLIIMSSTVFLTMLSALALV